MLHEIRGPDNKCTDMVAYYFQYHRDSMNPTSQDVFIHKRRHAQVLTQVQVTM